MFGGFEQFFSGGFPNDMPGHGGAGGDDSDDPDKSDSNKFYEIVGVSKDASANDIKKAYRKRARDLHPDRHPDEKEKYEAQFQELQRAYEVLSDPDKRKLYDRYGEQGLKGAGASSGGMNDIFSAFFGGDHPSRGQQKRKAPAIKVPLDVTLEDLYIGETKQINFKKMKTCGKCEGKGGSKVITCMECNGTGYQTIVQRMGMMSMRTQRPCSGCHGEGQTIPEKAKCKKCNAKGMEEERVELDVAIPPGSKHADQIILRNQGHEIPDVSTGDVVVIIRCAKHPIFKRVGADLAMNYKISLKEALCGYDIRIKHLARSVLCLKSKEGEITQPEQLKRVYSWGMPQKGASHVKGHLYIRFEVVLPQSGDIPIETLANIGKMLPDQRVLQQNQDGEDIPMDDAKESSEPQNGTSNNNKKKNNKKNKKGKNKNQNQNSNNTTEGDAAAMDDDYDDGSDFLEHVTAEDVDGQPTATPASNRSQYDEDDEQEGVQCRQM